MPYLEIQTNLNIFYDVVGQGEAVILLTGGMANLHVWDQVTDGLQGRYQVIRFDYQGTGESSGGEGPYDLALLSAELLALLDHLKISRAHLVGHSMGGFVSQYFSAHHPERVMSVSLLSSLLKINQPAIEFLSNLLSSAKRDLVATQVAIEGMVGSQPSLKTIEQHVALCLAHDSSSYIQKVTAPVLILWGAEEVGVDEHRSDPLLKKIQDLRRFATLNCGHMLPLEAPEAVVKELIGFLSNLNTTP